MSTFNLSVSFLCTLTCQSTWATRSLLGSIVQMLCPYGNNLWVFAYLYAFHFPLSAPEAAGVHDQNEDVNPIPLFGWDLLKE